MFRQILGRHPASVAPRWVSPAVQQQVQHVQAVEHGRRHQRSAAVAAVTVHREDLLAAVVMPPLVYVVLVLLGGVVERTASGGSFLVQQAIELVNALVLGAPVLLTATGLSLLVAVVRWKRSPSSR